jgi:clan AA aspartic protease (TIGR02281 family)
MGLSMRVILWACVILLLQVSWSWGKIYQWVDNKGRVHFTDNPATIPDAYRNQIETHTSRGIPSDHLAPRQARSQPKASATPSRAIPPPQAFVVPLKRAGNALFVQATLNGFVHVPLMVDTGASFTVISTQTAQRLGLNLERAAMIPMQSASGPFLAHLTKVRSMKVGDAAVKDVEVVVHDISPGREQGLLGMSFLDHFNVTIHTLQDAMNLKPLDQVAGMSLYGGKPQSWWQSRFRFYRQQVSLIDAYLARRDSSQLEQSRRYFRSELAMLERRARLASVPRAWRY